MKKYIFFFSMMILFCGCKETVNQFTGSGIGTFYSISYTGKKIPELQQSVDSLLDDISEQFSIFDSSSLIFKLNKGEEIAVTPDFSTLFSIASHISEITDGAFDITIAPLVNAWGFGNENRQTPLEGEIDSIRDLVGYEKVSIKENHLQKNDKRITINFNAIAKGFAVDKIGELLESRGCQNFLVEVGGEIVSKGKKGDKFWRVGIQTPTPEKEGVEESEYIFKLNNKAVATSGNYRNYKEENGIRYTHIIDPGTGQPERSNLLSVTVVADNCATADALATAFMVLGIEKSKKILLQHPEYAAYFIYDREGEFAFEKTDNFP